MKKLINYLSLYKDLSTSSIVAHPALAKTLLNLENRLLGAVKFLKDTSINIQGKKVELNSLPWFLLIGSEGVGKTTLLANSGVKFILNKKINPEEINSLPPSESCDWWVTSGTVLVDVPGSYTAYNENLITEQNKLFQQFLYLVQKVRGKQALNGVVVAVSLTELMDKNHREYLAKKLDYQLSEIRNKFDSLPIYFCITKCDLLPGFLEFFADYGSDELTQAWGVSMPSLAAHESLVDVFTYRFNHLIKRLNEQLIWRLHQERNPYTKLYVKDFPLHVERFKEGFIDLLKKLTEDNKNRNLKGVYLTSAIQNPEEEENNSPPQIVLAGAFQQALAIMRNPVLPAQAYFVKQFILHALTGSEPIMNPKKNRQHNIFYALAASIIVMLVIAAPNGNFIPGKLVSMMSTTVPQPALVDNKPVIKKVKTILV